MSSIRQLRKVIAAKVMTGNYIRNGINYSLTDISQCNIIFIYRSAMHRSKIMEDIDGFAY